MSALAPARLRMAEAFRQMAELPEADFADLGIGGLLVVAPHPDDESLGCGGLIAAACAAGIAVAVLVVSDGVGSHPNSPSHPPERLRALRERETLDAAAELGLAPAHVRFLRLPDRFVPTQGAAADAAVAAIATIARDIGADTLAVTWNHDPHCDHQAAFALTQRAGREWPEATILAYPIWGLARPPDDEIPDAAIVGFRLKMGAHLPAKRRAVAAHRSQTTALIDDDPGGFRLTPDDLARFDHPHEIFLKVRP